MLGASTFGVGAFLYLIYHSLWRSSSKNSANSFHQMLDASVCSILLLKESVTDDIIIDLLNVHKIELWNSGEYWTVLLFTSDKKDFPEQVSKVMGTASNNGGNWFVDFKAGNVKYIVFKDKMFDC